VNDAHAAVTDREDIESADYRVAGRPETPWHSGGVSPNVLRSVIFEHETRRGAIENLLSLVAQRLSPRVFSFWVDERHVFRVCSLDSRTSAFRVPLGKDVVQVAVKQLLRVRHAIKSFHRVSDPAAKSRLAPARVAAVYDPAGFDEDAVFRA
jgi:hypothetical protein